ncbi:MAG: hypothetical protein AB1750_17465, partial [Chloroflexota bacterium]
MKKPDLLEKLFQTDDTPEHRVTRRIVLAALPVALAAALTMIVLDINRNLMAVFGVAIAISLLLAHRGMLTPATILLPVMALALFGHIMYVNKGIRDTAVVGLPIVIVSASLMSRRGIGTIVLGALSLGVLFLLWHAE